MLIAAASAMAIAIAAMVVGSRRRAKDQYHPLKGVLERRMKMFGGMADGCYEDRELCGAQREEVMENEMTAVELVGHTRLMRIMVTVVTVLTFTFTMCTRYA